MLSGSTCVAGFYFLTTAAEIPSQMTEYPDNCYETAPQDDSIPDDDSPDFIPAIITAELALLDMLAHLIVDAVQRETTAPIAKDT
jgi:hypothetical protein